MGLLDLFRRKPDAGPSTAPPTAPPPKPTEEAGAGGSVTHGGYADSGEHNAEMRGTRRYTRMRTMATNIAIIGTALRRVDRLLGAVEWTMAPAKGEGVNENDAKDAADFAAHAIFKAPSTPWSKIVKRAGASEFWGHSEQEWTVRLEDDGQWPGRFVFADFAFRPPHTIERWDTDEQTGVVRGCWQRNPTTQAEIYLPRWKLLRRVDDVLSDSPEGTGLLRHVAELARVLEVYVNIEGKGFQNSVNGNMVGRVPKAEISKLDAAAQTAALAGIKDYLENHRKKENLSLELDSSTYKNADGTISNVPKWGIDVLQAANDLEELGDAINRVIRDIAIALCVEHILIGSDGGGSLAMMAQKSSDFFGLVMGILTSIGEIISSDAIDPLWVLNGLDPKLKPTPRFSRFAFHAIAEIVALLKQLADSGVSLDRADEAVKALFEFLGLPTLEVDEAAMMGARDAAAEKAGLKKKPDDDESIDITDDLED